MLHNLITSMIRTTANNPSLLARLIILNSNSILTDILKPHELKRTRTIAVHALSLVLADNNVPQGGARAEEEDGVGVAWSC
jgi:hypothetical protein